MIRKIVFAGLLPAGLAVLALTAVAGPAAANPAINCHCFQDRSYDPRRPAALDPYLLATTQNSLLAVVFEVPKRQLVRSKMGGTPNDRIWIDLHLARGSQRESDDDAAEARRIVDRTVSERLGIPEEEVQKTREMGAENAQLILAAFLARREEGSAAAIFNEVKEEKASWGQILTRAGVVVGEIEDELRRLLN